MCAVKLTKNKSTSLFLLYVPLLVLKFLTEKNNSIKRLNTNEYKKANLTNLLLKFKTYIVFFVLIYTIF